MLTHIVWFLIDSIVSCFVTIDLPRTDGTKQVSSFSCVATCELLSIDSHQFIHSKYLPRFGIVARSIINAFNEFVEWSQRENTQKTRAFVCLP